MTSFLTGTDVDVCNKVFSAAEPFRLPFSELTNQAESRRITAGERLDSGGLQGWIEG